MLGVVSMTLMGIGCSGAARRNASESLNQAIAASSGQAEEAQALLSNPVIGEVGVAETRAITSAQALLKSAEASLTEAISTARSGADTPFDADLGEASMTLARIQNLRGLSYQRMSSENATAIRSELRRARQAVSRMRTVANQMYRPVASLELLSNRPVKTAKMRAMLAEETLNVSKTNAAIDANDKAITVLRTQRDAMFTKSEQCKIAGSRLKGPEAQKLLNQGLALSKKAGETEKDISRRIREGVAMVSVLAEATTARTYASASLKHLEALKNRQAAAVATNKKELGRQLLKFKTLKGTLSDQLGVVQERAKAASECAKQGESFYEQAIQTSKQAEGLLGSSGRLRCLAVQSAIEAQSGDLYRASGVLAKEIQQFQESVASTWKLVPYKKPESLPVVELTTYVEANQDAFKLAIQRLDSAIEKQKEALGLCSQSNQWSFRWSLLTQQLNAAAVRKLAGQSGESIIQEVRGDLSQLEQEAEMAGRGQDIQTLRRMLESK